MKGKSNEISGKKKMILDGTFSQKENKFLLFMTLLK